MSGSTAFSFAPWMADALSQVEQALERWVVAPQLSELAPDLPRAMRYAVLDGGKRLRPLLVLAAHEACSAETGASTHSAQAALRAACAVELIHAYSLVHDDMPCMDNDVLRRGKPTVHVEFGQATALLAGDALQALAFELLTPAETDIDPLIQARLCAQLARAAGHGGMAGGQAIDLAHVGRSLQRTGLQRMHELKTGALLQCSVVLGALCGAADAQALSGLNAYGAAIGLAFQVVDDVLDVTADSATLGKTAGKDADANKPTYVSTMGLEASQRYAHTLLAQAEKALRDSGLRETRALQALAHMVVERAH
ncbi:MAG: polyprenyl synthetase family protein [Betaproteobacteria bacterium]|nr:polyprenyl synthetase family protein [Betaproteobacteria bacterium]